MAAKTTKPAMPPPAGFVDPEDVALPGVPPPAGFVDAESAAPTTAITRLSPEEFHRQAMNNYAAVASAPNEDSGILSTLLDAGGGMRQTFHEGIVGLGKSALGLAYGLGKFARSDLGNMVRSDPALRGNAAVAPSPLEQEPNDITDWLAAKTPAEKFGKGVGDIAQFFIPGGTSTIKGALAVDAATKAYKLPLLARMGIEGLSGAAVGGAQGSNPLVTGAGAVTGVGMSAAMEKFAPKLVDAILLHKGTPSTRASGGKGIVDEGLIAKSLPKLQEMVRAARESVGQKIGTAIGLSRAAQRAHIDVISAVDGPINDAITALKTAGNKSAATRLEALRAGMYDRLASLRAPANAASPSAVWTIRDELDKGINWASNAEGTEVAAQNVIKKIRGKLADELRTAVPELKDLMPRYANLAKANTDITKRLEAPPAGSMGEIFHSPAAHALSYLGTGYSLYHMFHNPAEVAAMMAGYKLGTSTPAVTATAAALHAAGSPLGSALLSRGGAAAAGAVNQPTAAKAKSRVQALVSP